MPAHILPKLIQDLVYQSENESDEFVKKAIKDALLKIFKQNNPKNPNLWNELGDLRIRLKSSG
ncbi:MAG: hypothetical protein CL725_01445 [Chloroflexi bacterium]|jgi:hypothetical protein|nr:hypothetical protein [Chloroflexota bacterium]MBU16350.1 hypothetical protein [Chloroflexota bacterium]|tara:strand:+ start:3849 stop:4037 length:189 start_codon:yes stop_codon:yes gene_type:complete